MNLLIIEDERSIADNLAVLLADKFSSIEISENGIDALKTCKDFKPDLIISDLNMPKLDGVGFLAEYIKVNKKPVIIYFSAYVTEAIKMEALMLGALDLIDKPNTDLLFKRVQEVLDSNMLDDEKSYLEDDFLRRIKS